MKSSPNPRVWYSHEVSRFLSRLLIADTDGYAPEAVAQHNWFWFFSTRNVPRTLLGLDVREMDKGTVERPEEDGYT